MSLATARRGDQSDARWIRTPHPITGRCKKLSRRRVHLQHGLGQWFYTIKENGLRTLHHLQKTNIYCLAPVVIPHLSLIIRCHLTKSLVNPLHSSISSSRSSHLYNDAYQSPNIFSRMVMFSMWWNNNLVSGFIYFIDFSLILPGPALWY